MAKRKPFLLRVPEELLDELRRWAEDEMRSLNGQIEFVLRDALRRRGRASGGEEEGAGGPKGPPPAGPASTGGE